MDMAPVYLTPAVAPEQMLANMRAAIARGLPVVTPCKAHGHLMSIAGGGPSLADTYDQMSGFICSVNGSLKWLLEHDQNGLASYACGVMDAGAHIADGLVAHPNVRYYVASVCDPAVFDKLKDCDVRLWHVTPQSTEDTSGVEALLNEAYPNGWHAIAGGCTMGLRWVNLGYFLGFRKFHLHGMDSSFRKGATHAYPDRADSKEHIFFDGFETRHNFLAQVHDFADMLEWLHDFDCNVEMEVFGDGLLQNEWKAFREANPTAYKAGGTESFQFPAGEQHGSDIAAECRGLSQALLPHLGKRGLAVQAGGNVGILPKLLAEHFDVVHTFEPDAENFRCLKQNVTEPNVVAYPCALGSLPGHVGIARGAENCGQAHVNGEGLTPMRSIDSLKLPACDLIALDVEGYELEALKGASVTIGKYAPVICLEENGLCERYGVKQGQAIDWLVDTFGYGVVGMHGRDVILTPQ
jgi:FkbM family methyltransferase